MLDKPYNSLPFLGSREKEEESMGYGKFVVIIITILFVGTMVIPNLSGLQTKENLPIKAAQLSIEQPWWNHQWSYRKQILINHTKVSGNLTNFPVLIQIVSSDLANHSQKNGYDFVFVNETGYKLNHEIESYDSVNGVLLAWVNVTSLNNNKDTILWLYYGNPKCSDQQDIEDTWDGSYYAVWHLSNNQWKDSTRNHRDLTDGTPNATTTTNGQVGNCAFFNGTNRLQTIISATDLQNFALELWINPESSIMHYSPISKSNTTYTDWRSYDWYLTTEYDYGSQFMLKVHYDSNQESDYWDWNGGQTLNTWEYYTLNYFSGQQAYGWRLPTPINNDSPYGNATNSTTYTSLIQIGGLTGSLYQGLVDEVRISTHPRSQDWHNTSLNNMQNPASFITIGAEEFGGSNFKHAFMFGKYSNLTSDNGLFTVEAVNLRIVELKPFQFLHYTAHEKITYSERYKGIMTSQFLLGAFDLVI